MTSFFDIKKQRPKTNLEKCYQCSVTMKFLWTSKFASNVLKLRSIRPIRSLKFQHCDGYLLPLIFKSKNKTSLSLKASSEPYPEGCQTRKMQVFANIVNGFSFLTIFAKSSILNIWQDFELVSEARNDLRKKLHLSCLTGF